MKNNFFENDVLYYEPTLAEKLRIIFINEAKGKKRGYELASKEYNDCYERLKKIWEETIDTTNTEKKSIREKLEHTKERHEFLLNYKTILEEEVKKMTKGVSKKYSVPLEQVVQLYK